MKPTVLMLYCHGGENPQTKKISLWAEKALEPSLVHHLDESALRDLLRSCKNDKTFESVKLVILSACYSEDIA